jgi:hypothetical protein
MPRFKSMKALGLYTDPNPLELSNGALLTALNVVIDRADLIQPRRGFTTHSTITSSRNVWRLAYYIYQGLLLAHWDDGAGSYKLSYYAAGWNTITGSYRAPDDNAYKMRFVEATKNLYFTTTTGVFRMEGSGVTPLNAGMPKAIPIDRASSTVAAGACINANAQRAYRVRWKFTDGNGNLHLGSPSGRILMQNTNAAGGAAKDPTLRILLPKQNGTGSTALTTSYLYQLYASSNSPDLTTEPPNDEALVYEKALDGTAISNGYVDVTDITPDNLRGAALETNPALDGILQASDPPPYAREVAQWKDRTVYIDTQTRYRNIIQMIAAPADGDTMVINGFTVIFKTAPTLSNHVQIDATAGLSTAQKIFATAHNLVGTINRYATNTSIDAHYLGDPSDARSLGKILLEGRDFTSSPDVTLTVGTGTKWEPVLSAVAVVAAADAYPNGMYISKPNEPEAVPALQFFRHGSGGNHSLRGVELGESFFVFKEKEDAYKITGEPPTAYLPQGQMRQERILTGHCLSPDCIAKLGDAIYALTTRGVVRVTEGAVEVVSTPIDKSILDTIAVAGLSAVRNHAFAVAYETDHKYILSLPTRSDALAMEQWVFNEKTNAWTRWNRYQRCGILNPSDDTLYLSATAGSAPVPVVQERKARTSADYQDESGAAISATVAWGAAGSDDPTTPMLYSEGAVHFATTAPTTTTITFTSSLTGAASGVAVTATGKVARCGVPQEQRRCAWLVMQADIAQASCAFDIAGISIDGEEEGELVTR